MAAQPRVTIGWSWKYVFLIFQPPINTFRAMRIVSAKWSIYWIYWIELFQNPSTGVRNYQFILQIFFLVIQPPINQPRCVLNPYAQSYPIILHSEVVVCWIGWILFYFFKTASQEWVIIVGTTNMFFSLFSLQLIDLDVYWSHVPTVEQKFSSVKWSICWFDGVFFKIEFLNISSYR